MPIEYTTGTIAALSETVELTSADIGLYRGITGIFNANAPTVEVTGIGRNRAQVGLMATSVTNFDTTIYRTRYCAPLATTITEAICTEATVVPGVAKPTGGLKIDGQPFRGGEFPKGKSLNISYEIKGKKLENMFAELFILDLSDIELIHKKSRLNPGGIVQDSATLQVLGETSYLGNIPLLRNDTIFTGSPDEYECKYVFCIGNSRQNHLIERGFITFYKP